jgi:DNA-binding CsgD family transcriptional regulator/tetratricopeptide (TPR) repeat protein
VAAAAPEVFVGRAGEFAVLEQALAAAAEGCGGCALVAGEAGIGKTRLVGELCDRATAAGFQVLLGRCLDLIGTELPYQAVTDALRPLTAAQAASQLAGAPAWRAAASQLAVFEQVLELISLGAESAPVLIVVEDVHWADTSTLDLLVYLAHNLDQYNALLIATCRADEPASTDSMHWFADSIRRSRAGRTITLGPLVPDDLATLLLARAEGPLPETVRDSIMRRSQGNPFYAEELLAVVQGSAAPLPDALRDLLLRHLRRLDPATQEVLQVIAALGGQVTHELLVDTVRTTEQRLRRAVRDAVDQRVLVVDQTASGYRFRHPMIAEAVYSTILPGEREDLHLRIATRLVATDVGAAELAHHWAASRRPAEALAASIHAARDAEKVFGLAEAHAHIERAIILWPSVPDAQQRAGTDLISILRWAAQLAGETGAGGRAVQLARQAITLVDTQQQPLQAALLHVRLGEYLHQIGRTQDMIPSMQKAVDILAETRTAERAYALASLAGAVMVNWRHAESLPIAEEALNASRQLGADDAVVQALTIHGSDLAYLGRAQEGVTELRQALRLAQRTGDRIGLHRAYVNLTDAVTMLGRPREAAQLAHTGLDQLHRVGVHSSVLQANYIEALLAIGDWDEADRQTTLALRSITANFPYMIHMMRADLDTGRGDFQAASAQLEQARATLRPDHGYGIYEIYHAELALWQHRWTDAHRHATEALSRSRTPQTEQLRVWFIAKALRAHAELSALARARRDTKALGRWTDHAAEVITDARRAAATASAITPNVHGWLALAEAEYARTRTDQCSEPWQAAATTWDELDRPALAAYCRWRQAEALIHSGAPRDQAAPSLRCAYQTASRLSATPLRRELEALAQRARLDPRPAPDVSTSTPLLDLGLTPREIEVLALLARGRTNREIAHDLTISEKTASVHVSHILNKLHAENRHQAAAIANRLASWSPPMSAAPESHPGITLD